MSDSKDTKRSNLGCATLIVGALALIIGGGVWLGQRSEQSRTPCQKWVAAVTEGLKNCHSGQTKNYQHHMTICKQRVDATPACLERVKSLSCDQLERGAAASAGEVCARGR